MDLITIVVSYFEGWYDSVTVTITAIPAGFGLPLIMIAAGFFTLGLVNYILEWR